MRKVLGVSKDDKEAVAWYLKAALQGNSAAQYNLAVLCENGRGCDVNFAQAHQWYRKAAVQGDGLAVGNLGMLYLRGQGVKEDKIDGLALLKGVAKYLKISPQINKLSSKTPKNDFMGNILILRYKQPLFATPFTTIVNNNGQFT